MPASRADRRLERAARRWTGDARAAGQLREHYAIERALATRLREAPPETRGRTYGEVYDELFAAIPHHPQLRRRSSVERQGQVERELYFLRPCLRPGQVFVEIGSGDQGLARAVAGIVGEVHAVDVASEIAPGGEAVPDNVHTHVTDGRRLPLADGSVGLAYSNQLMEHLHPDDAAAQMREVFRVLAPGGAYLCVTPNRLTGPWDVSRMFSPEPTGLHLREYANGELAALLRETGFARVRAVVPVPGSFGRGRARAVRVSLFTRPERVLQALPFRARRALLRGWWAKPLNSVRLLAVKAPQPRPSRSSRWSS